MNPLVQLNLALILFLPWFLILGALFWLYPRQPRPPARKWLDAGALALALLAFVLAMRWGHGWADPGYGHMWRQIVATAVQEDVDAIGLSVLSGAHNYLFKRVLDLLREQGADDIAVFGGGIIPQDDIQALKAMGVKELFTPGTSTQDIIRFVRDNIRAVA